MAEFLLDPATGNKIDPRGLTADQDPIFDHASGVKVTVGTSATDILTPAAGCKFVRISGDADVFVRTDGSPAVDDGHCIRVVKDQPETIPVVPGQKLSGIVTTGTATVRATPLKVR